MPGDELQQLPHNIRSTHEVIHSLTTLWCLILNLNLCTWSKDHKLAQRLSKLVFNHDKQRLSVQFLKDLGSIPERSVRSHSTAWLAHSPKRDDADNARCSDIPSVSREKQAAIAEFESHIREQQERINSSDPHAQGFSELKADLDE